MHTILLLYRIHIMRARQRNYDMGVLLLWLSNEIYMILMHTKPNSYFGYFCAKQKLIIINYYRTHKYNLHNTHVTDVKIQFNLLTNWPKKFGQIQHD